MRPVVFFLGVRVVLLIDVDVRVLPLDLIVGSSLQAALRVE
jgi:hypothetical protein